MSASLYVGRVGALAAAFGVGAAIFTGPAVAWADPTADVSTTQDSTAGAPTQKAPATRGHAAQAARGPRKPSPSPSKTSEPSSDTSEPSSDPSGPSSDTSTADLTDAVQRDVTPTRSSDSAESAAPRPAAATAAKANNDGPVAATATDSVANTTAPDPTPAAPAEPAVTVATSVPAPAAAQSVTSVVETATTAAAPAKLTVTSNAVKPAFKLQAVIAKVANQVSTLLGSAVHLVLAAYPGHLTFAPLTTSPLNWVVFAAASRKPEAAAATASVVSTPATPTLVLNGYNVVPASIETIDAFTGRWAYWPGQPNMKQGRQDFTLVDPSTGANLGSFSALVSSGDPTSVGAKYVEMLVTANDGKNVGTDPGQNLPVGSVISDFSVGLVGLSYASMPSPSGDKVMVKLKTPFFSIPLPLTFDASKGIVDHTFDNRPMDVTGGYSIAPADPAGEKLTGSIGQLPLFNSIQGAQKYGIYNATGEKVGTFDGLFTTTSDTIGIYTQEILVTGNDGVNVGTNPGQTPPAGTVYNVAYFGNDQTWLLYSSMPQKSGDVITLKLGTPKGVTDLTTLGLPNWLFPQTTFNASREPEMKSMVAPGGQKFVATSKVIPSGVNGLPPRDMQQQGYQQFDVYDFLGRKIGTVDAQVESQWDSSFGPHAKAILITDVTSGNVGTTPLNVPPPGTVLNFIDLGGGFGFSDSTIPQTVTNLSSFAIITPFGRTPLPPSIAVATHPEVKYTNPFLV